MANDEVEALFFPLLGCWEDSFSNLAKSLLRLVRARELSGAELAATAKLIGALNRLPLATDGIGIEASLGTKDKTSRGSLVLQLSTNAMSMGYFEVFDSSAGSDHESRAVLDVEVSGYSSVAVEDPAAVMNALAGWVVEWSRRAVDPEQYTYEIHDDAQDELWRGGSLAARWRHVPYGF
jgi:hypothetical protein